MVKQHLAQLAGRVHVEVHAREVFDFLLQHLQLLAQLGGVGAQAVGVEVDAFEFHVGQHLDQRHLHGVKELLGVALADLRREGFAQLEGDVSVLGGVVHHLGGVHVGHVALVLALFANEGFDGNGLVVQVGLGQDVHAVLHVGVDQVVGHHGVKHLVLDVHVVAAHDLVVVLEVVGHHFLGRIVKHGAELVHNALGHLPVLRDGHVIRLAFFHRKGQPYQIGFQRVE